MNLRRNAPKGPVLAEPAIPELADNALVLAPSEETTQLTAEFDPFSFVEEQRAALSLSHEMWTSLANNAKGLKNAAIQDSISQAFMQSVERARPGAKPPQNIIFQAAKRVNTQLPTYTLLSARYDSVTNTPPNLSEFTTLGDERGILRHVSTMSMFPWQRLCPIHQDMVQKMTFADKASGKVMTDLATAIKTPNDILGLAELYEGGVASQDAAFAELQRIISADWHQPDATKSQSRQLVARLEEDSSQFVSEFSKEVAAGNGDQSLKVVRNMAKLAILAMDGDASNITPERIENVLVSTKPLWDEVDYVVPLFDAFVRARSEIVKSAFASIAGNPNPGDLRVPPTKKQLDAFKRSMEVSIKSKQTMGTKGGQSRLDVGKMDVGNLPRIESIERLETQTIEKEPRQLVRIKETGKSKFTTVPFEIDDLGDVFKLPQDRLFREDAHKLVEYLQEAVMSRAVHRLRKTEPITIDGKPTKMWRLAAEAIPNIGVSTNNRFMRVVFASLGKDKVVILGVHTHAEFNNEYGSQL